MEVSPGAFSSCYHSVSSPMKIKEPFPFSSPCEVNRKFLTEEVGIEYPSMLWMVLGIEIKHEDTQVSHNLVKGTDSQKRL